MGVRQPDRQIVSPNRLYHGFYDDFHSAVTAHEGWTSTVADGGAVIATATTGAAGGILNLTDSSATDNDEVYWGRTTASFLFANDKPLYAEARIQFAEANTSAANIGVGLLSTANGANMLLDDGGGPPASYTGALWFKVDGGTVWNVESSVGGTQTTDATTITAGRSTYTTLGIEFIPITSTLADLNFLIDIGDGNGLKLAKKQAYTYTSAVEMRFALMLKHGSTTTEILLADYAKCFQLR